MKSFVELHDLVLTPGVTVADDTISCDGLALSIPLSTDDVRRVVLESGMASDGPRGWIFAGAFRVRYRCAPLRKGLTSAVVHCVSHYAASLLPVAAAIAGLMLIGIAADLPSLIAISLLVVMLMISVVVHEVGHVVVFRLVAGAETTAHMVVRGISFSLVRRPLERNREILVVIAGPLAPLALAVLAVPLSSVGPLLWWAWLVFGGGHALTLLFPQGDGANLRLAVSDRGPTGSDASETGFRARRQ